MALDENVTEYIKSLIESRPRAKIITENSNILLNATESEIECLDGHDS